MRPSRRGPSAAPRGASRSPCPCRSSYWDGYGRRVSTYPKIELHVHLEGTVRAETLREIAKRNDYPLPDDLESLYTFRDFRHFIEVFELSAGALSRYDDFRQVVVDYAGEAASHGAVYLEAIFAPGL